MAELIHRETQYYGAKIILAKRFISVATLGVTVMSSTHLIMKGNRKKKFETVNLIIHKCQRTEGNGLLSFEKRRMRVLLPLNVEFKILKPTERTDVTSAILQTVIHTCDG